MNSRSVSINEVAERILFGPEVTDKLYFEESARDNLVASEPIHVPSVPARSDKIKICFDGSEKFPATNSLTNATQKAKALHHFANHELLAIELMALTLLKFPNAPKAFRKGVYQTISEEQKHFKLYVDRIRDLGHDFGDFPLNGFFWSHMSKIKSIEEYLSQMSLTFEQANLDFAKFYRDVFAELGDHHTAQILDEVLQDEIKHVKFGKVWLEKNTPKGDTLWENFKRHLKFPITPARAKGKIFNHEARLRADLPEEYIKEVELYTQSKGRVPNVYYFNPDAELELATKAYSAGNYAADLAHDLEDIFSILAPRDEVVIVRERPSLNYLESLKPLVPHPPELIVKDSNLDRNLDGRRFNEFRPWAFSPSSLEVKDELFSELKVPDTREMKLWHSKAFSFELLCQYLNTVMDDPKDWLSPTNHLGTTFSSLDDLLEFVGKTKIFDTFLVRGPYGISGQNARVVNKDSLKTIQPFLEEQFATHQLLLVEPYYDVEDSFSFQIKVSQDGDFKFLGLSQFLTDEKNQYRGALVRPNIKIQSNDLQYKILEALKKEGSLREFLGFVAKSYSKLGYFGPMGVDAFTYAYEGKTFLKPLSEVNCRTNFGSMTVALRKLVAPGKSARWEILNKANAPRESRFKTKNGMITEGKLLTNCPEKARRFVSVLSVK